MNIGTFEDLKQLVDLHSLQGTKLVVDPAVIRELIELVETTQDEVAELQAYAETLENDREALESEVADLEDEVATLQDEVDGNNTTTEILN